MVVELAVWRGETEAIVVPHVALAASGVDLSTAPATAAATVLGGRTPSPATRTRLTQEKGGRCVRRHAQGSREMSTADWGPTGGPDPGWTRPRGLTSDPSKG